VKDGAEWLAAAERASQDRRAGNALTELVLSVFRLNGLFLSVAETISRPAGLTSARWQVLGAVLREPLPVSGVARAMGLTRQSVQRLADALVADGMAEYAPNPAHRRAKLLCPTPRGLAAIDVLRPRQHAWADQVTADLDPAEIERTVAVLRRLIGKLENDPWRPA
jgi:DNA-binding MarR family transcriptional regulator